MKTKQVTANQIVSLLARRHTKDVFLSECKTGYSWSRTAVCRRLDAWAMRKSWTKPYSYGYEIKVSRADWLRDRKWEEYLPFCTHFFIVTTPGVITDAKKEIPAEVGWLETSKKGGRLFIKKNAKYRKLQVPEDLYRYILMWRSEINDSQRGLEVVA